MQHAGFTHQGLGDSVAARDGGQIGVEHAGEGEQVVALVLQRDAHRTDASRVLGLAGYQLRDDEVEQLSPRRQVRTGIGDGVVGPQPPLGGVEQVHAPGVGVTMLLRRQGVVAAGGSGAGPGMLKLPAPGP